jgi:hypothetical protein
MKFFSRKTDSSKDLDKQTRKNTLANARPKIQPSASYDSDISQAETISSDQTSSLASRSTTKSSSSSANPHKKDKARKTKHIDDHLIDAYRQANQYQTSPVFWSWS